MTRASILCRQYEHAGALADGDGRFPPAGDGVVVQLQDFFGRRADEFRRGDRGDRSGEEPGEDFVHAGVLQEDDPQDVGGSADDDAGHRALEVELAPEERQEDRRAERRAEESPGVFHQPHDGAGVRIGGDHERNDGHRKHDEASDPHDFPVGCLVLADDRLVDVAGERGRSGKQLAVGGTH